MTDDDKALVERLRTNDAEIYLPILGEAAFSIEILSAENERLFEQHEAFRQEVSDAVVNHLREYLVVEDGRYELSRFIITKPDPLVDALAELNYFDPNNSAKNLYAALAKRGLEIREKKDD